MKVSKLIEAQAEARLTTKRLSHDEVFGPFRQKGNTKAIVTY
jgi:hypothetical protein